MLLKVELIPMSRFDSLADSNRLFRVLISAIARIEGKKSCDDFIKFVQENKDCKISSFIPKIKNKIFFPVCRGLIKKIEQQEKAQILTREDEKKLKKRAYVEREKLAKLLQDPTIEHEFLDQNLNYYKMEKESGSYRVNFADEKIKKVAHSFTHPHNQVPNKIIMDHNKEKTKIFYEFDIVFNSQILENDLRLVVLAKGPERFLEKVKTSFKYLEYFGISHSYTAGRGQIRVDEKNSGKIEEEKIISGLEGYLISTLSPTVEEAKKIDWRNSVLNYALHQSFRSDNKFGYALPIISAGSVLRGYGAEGQIIYAGEENEENYKRGVYFARGFYI